MSDQIATHYAVQYANMVSLLLQQKGSKLSDTVTLFPITGAKAASPVDQIGATEAVQRTTRYPALTPMNQPTDRPWVYPSDWDWMDLLDSIDKLRMLTDPQSSYVTNGTYALGRAKDRIINNAFFADRNTGEQGGTVTSFPAANQVAVNHGAAGNVGLTVAKMREAKRLLMSYEVDLETEQLTLLVTSKEHDALLAEVQVISLDYQDKPVMKEGKVDRFLGFGLKHYERLSLDGSGHRRLPAYAKSGMVLGQWNDIQSDVSIRRDLAGLPVQVYVYGTWGATRNEENKIIEIKCAV